jgi:hypothetical protein
MELPASAEETRSAKHSTKVDGIGVHGQSLGRSAPFRQSIAQRFPFPHAEIEAGRDDEDFIYAHGGLKSAAAR